MLDHPTPSNFSRQDESDDLNFYQTPRMVTHIDETAIASVTNLIRRYVPAHSSILDLMSSYRSHLPSEIAYQEVIGLGLNLAEMQANPQLTRCLVHNLNADPILPFPSGHFNAVLNTVSVQYLVHPIEVFREVARVLKPGGISIVAFSDRMFPTKAVNIWSAGSNEDHIALVKDYYKQAGGFTPALIERHEDARATWFWRNHDPLFAVLANRLSSSHQ